MRPLYLLRPTADPISAIESRAGAEGGGDARSGGAGTAEALASRLKASGKRTVIVIDQFEEFFLLNRPKASLEPVRESLARLLHDGSPEVGSLVGVRPAFSARLQHLAPE